MRTLRILKLSGTGTSCWSNDSAKGRIDRDPFYLPPVIRVGCRLAHSGSLPSRRLGTTTLSGRVDSHTLFTLVGGLIAAMLE
jgi:hypothetical protein